MYNTHSSQIKVPTIQLCKAENVWQEIKQMCRDFSTRISAGEEVAINLQYRTNRSTFFKGAGIEKERITKRFPASIVTEVETVNPVYNRQSTKVSESLHFNSVGIVGNLLYDLDRGYYNTPRHLRVREDGRMVVTAQVSRDYIVLLKELTNYGRKLNLDTLCNKGIVETEAKEQVTVRERVIFSVDELVAGEGNWEVSKEIKGYAGVL